MIKLFVIFILTLVLDGLILPALFGFKNSLFSIIFLFVTILFFGTEKQHIIYVLVFSIILELLKGLSLGNLASPLLIVIVLTAFAQRFFDIKYTYDTRFNFMKSAFISILSVVIFHAFAFLYKWKMVDIFFNSLSINLIILVEAMVLVLVFSLTFNDKKYFNV